MGNGVIKIITIATIHSAPREKKSFVEYSYARYLTETADGR